MFTGATHAKPGKFELCNKGTILLDEIGEMPALLQAKLLHVLQDQTFSRLGSRTVVKVDVRILAATNIDIPEALASTIEIRDASIAEYQSMLSTMEGDLASAKSSAARKRLEWLPSPCTVNFLPASPRSVNRGMSFSGY